MSEIVTARAGCGERMIKKWVKRNQSVQRDNFETNDGATHRSPRAVATDRVEESIFIDDGDDLLEHDSEEETASGR